MSTYRRRLLMTQQPRGSEWQIPVRPDVAANGDLAGITVRLRVESGNMIVLNGQTALSNYNPMLYALHKAYSEYRYGGYPFALGNYTVITSGTANEGDSPIAVRAGDVVTLTLTENSGTWTSDDSIGQIVAGVCTLGDTPAQTVVGVGRAAFTGTLEVVHTVLADSGLFLYAGARGRNNHFDDFTLRCTVKINGRTVET